MQEAYDGAMQPRQGETPAERLKAMTQALTDHAKAVIKEAQDKLRLEKEGDKGGQTDEADKEGEDQGGGRAAGHPTPGTTPHVAEGETAMEK